MRNIGLQVIVDRSLVKDGDILKAAAESIKGGAGCIQLRDKVSTDRVLFNEATALRRLTKDAGAKLIINDRVDIAMVSDADGLHLGSCDMPYREARRLMGPDKIIGISTRNIKEALLAQAMGADYVGTGPIFTTTTKPALAPIGLEAIPVISKELNMPVFFIGGIRLENITEIIKRGGSHVAVADAILNSSDIAKTTKAFIDILKTKNRFELKV